MDIGLPFNEACGMLYKRGGGNNAYAKSKDP